MAFASPLALILLTITPCLFFTIPQVHAQPPPLAPVPSPSGPINLTAILARNGQFTTLIRLLTATQIDNQIENQLNNSNQGMTVFAATDNAFQNLLPGALNRLSDQQKRQLLLYHALPKYYSLVDLLTVSNPVQTLANGQDGGRFGLNFTSSGNQVNVSTGVVETQLNNAVRQVPPLAVYQVDKVLLPLELFRAKSPTSAPAPPKSPSGTSAKTPDSSPASPFPSQGNNSSSSGRNMGLRMMWGIIGLVCMCLG